MSGAAAMKVEINMSDGNLSIGSFSRGEQLLASGALQYLENQAQPTLKVETENGKSSLTFRSGAKGQPWLRLPWAACNGATDWLVRLNPALPCDLDARTGGGNVTLNLEGTLLNSLAAETGGGNLDVTLPGGIDCLNVKAKTGAGNVTITIPAGAAARILATTGIGTVLADARFSKSAKDTYETPGYASAAQKMEITLSTGAGNVVIKEMVTGREPALSPA